MVKCRWLETPGNQRIEPIDAAPHEDDHDLGKGAQGMTHKRTSKIVTEKDSWETPNWLFDLLDREFNFLLDAAASITNHKVPTYYTVADSALDKRWEKRTYLNPPYSAGNIDKFMAKALEESQKGAVVVCLVPCATDTRWWYHRVLGRNPDGSFSGHSSDEIRFIKGRVKFIGYDECGKQIKNSPTFSSCVVIFRPVLKCKTGPFLGECIVPPQKDINTDDENTIL